MNKLTEMIWRKISYNIIDIEDIFYNILSWTFIREDSAINTEFELGKQKICSKYILPQGQAITTISFRVRSVFL